MPTTAVDEERQGGYIVRRRATSRPALKNYRTIERADCQNFATLAHGLLLFR